MLNFLFHSVLLCILARIVLLCRLDRAVYHPLTPLAFEDYLIHQRMLGVGVEKMKWIRTLRLSLCCHELVAWLPSERASDGGDFTCCLFTHTHRHRKTVEKRYHCQYNIGNSNIQCQHYGAQMLLDPCYITSGWQVLITLCKVSTYFPTAVCKTAKREINFL